MMTSGLLSTTLIRVSILNYRSLQVPTGLLQWVEVMALERVKGELHA